MPRHLPHPPPPPPVPEAMPFDIPYGTPISVDQAQKAITAAAAEAKKHNWKMSISVVDPAGNLIAHATMDGTQYALDRDLPGQGPHRGAVSAGPSGVFQAAINTGGSPSTLSLLALTRGSPARADFRSWSTAS